MSQCFWQAARCAAIQILMEIGIIFADRGLNAEKLDEHDPNFERLE
ncbi:MAG: hypothetical protein ACPG70_01900 [Candidatus Puniceispirillaceae bacterium]